MPKPFEAGFSSSPASRPERRGAKPVGRRDALEPRPIANDADEASDVSARRVSEESGRRIQALRKSNEEHRARRAAEIETERLKAAEAEAAERQKAAEAKAAEGRRLREEAEQLAAKEAAERAEKAAKIRERRAKMSDAAKQDLREAAAKIRKAHRGLEKEKTVDVGAAAKEISSYFLNAEALQAYARDLSRVAKTALDTNELAMPDGRQFPVEWSMDDVRSLVGRLDTEVALKKEGKVKAEKRAKAISGYDTYAKEYQERKEERRKMTEEIARAGSYWEAAEKGRAQSRWAENIDQLHADVEARRSESEKRALADEVEFASEDDIEELRDEVEFAPEDDRRRSVLEADIRRLDGELVAAKLDLEEARKSRSVGVKIGAFLRSFGGKPNAADEAMGELEAEVRMKENALEKAQRDLQDLQVEDVHGAADTSPDLEGVLYSPGEQAKMMAHDVLGTVAVAPKGWSKPSIDRARVERRGQATAELDGRGYGGASRVGMSERLAEAAYDVPEESDDREGHVAFSEEASAILGKEAVEGLMRDIDHAAEMLEARADGGEKSMQDAVEELGRMDFSPNLYAKLTADLYEAVVKAGPKERVMASPEVQRLVGKIRAMNELLAKGGALHGNPAERFFQS